MMNEVKDIEDSVEETIEHDKMTFKNFKGLALGGGIGVLIGCTIVGATLMIHTLIGGQVVYCNKDGSLK